MQRSVMVLRRPPRRGLRCGFLFVVFVLDALVPVFGAEPDYRIGPPPDWVEHIAPEETAVAPVGQVSDGIYYLLSDVQVRAGTQEQLQYRHYATKALNENGVETIAHIAIRFDPAYQTLTLHAIQVRRGGRVISKLDRAAIRILQREKQLEYRIYDGSKTANVFLDDVRVGDIVEYAYTLRGANPVFGNRLHGQFDLQWNMPVHRLAARLLWPAGRELYLAHHGTDRRPVVRELGNYREYRWQAQQLPALVVEDDAPSWYDPYPWVQWSEFRDWESVSHWAQQLYRVPERLSPALQVEADRIARENVDPQQRLLAALRFVQKEIRYLGVEIGAGSYSPSAPSLVLERRFGDCKDKSLLTVTLLRALGVEAHAALVNTELQRAIRDWHPTPSAFNHVLVQARLGGQDYWIDPTRLPQKGDLASLYQPDYGYALVVDASTRALKPMARTTASISKRKIHVVFDARAGLDQPVHYRVTSELEGASAESQRGILAAENREELQKKYLNFYARYYPSITAATPFSVREDERFNRLTMVEQYVIPDFWRHAKEKQRREAEIHSPDVAGYLQQPRQPVRRAPLRLAHPVDVTQTTEVLLPMAWDIRPERIEVDDPAFRFERRIAYAAQDRRLVLTDHYRSRADQIEPDQIARYVSNLARVDEGLGYSLYLNDRPPVSPAGWVERFNWPVAVAAVLALLLWTSLAVRLYRYDPPHVAAVVDARLQGIGGWLVLPAIGVVVQPIRVFVDFIGLLPSYATDVWANLTTAGGAAYHPLWAPLLLFELGANLALIVFTLLLVALFFQKRRSAPYVFIGVMAGAVVVQLVDLWLANALPVVATQVNAKDWNELARGAVNTVVWGSYFLVSRRVKSTFVNMRPVSRPAAIAGQSAG